MPCWNVEQHFCVVVLQVAVPHVTEFGVPLDAPLDVPPSVAAPSVVPPSVVPPELDVVDPPPLEVVAPPDVEDVDVVLPPDVELPDGTAAGSSVDPPHARIVSAPSANVDPTKKKMRVVFIGNLGRAECRSGS